MRSKATNAINHAMPTLKEMKMHLQQARFEGKELPKVPAWPKPSSWR